jgi:DNA-directed RNA polymerase subunit RPC12/RpoP
MKKSYHCSACNKEFIDEEMATEHRKSSGHQITQRILEK